MAKGVKKGKTTTIRVKATIKEHPGVKEIPAQEDDDKTIIYMIVGFCVGAIVALIFFEYYWVGVGGGAGMLVGILVSTVVDYVKSSNVEVPVKKTKKKSKK